MPLPDPYVNEPATQVNPDLVAEWRDAEEKALQWAKYAEKLKAQLVEQIGSSHAGMVGDNKVITYRPTDRWATARLIKERGDLAQHFMHQVTREEFDLSAFKGRHPDVAEEYRVRSFRAVAAMEES